MLFHPSLAAEGGLVRLETATRHDALAILQSWHESALRDSWHHSKPRTLEDEKAYLEDIEASSADHLFKVIRLDGDVLIGTCGLHEFDGHVLAARIGFCVLCDDPCLTGCIQETIVLARDVAYATLGLRCVYVHALPDDEATQEMLRGIGFIAGTRPLPCVGHKGHTRMAIYMEHLNHGLLG